jgi:hypothetical protein
MKASAFSRLLIAFPVALVGLGSAPHDLHAQAYPAKSVRMIVPFAPGGNTDIIGRIFAPKMGEILGQQIIVDNRGGAGQHDRQRARRQSAARWLHAAHGVGGSRHQSGDDPEAALTIRSRISRRSA